MQQQGTRVEVSSFEIIRNNDQSSSKLKKPLLFGYIDIDDDSQKAFSTLKALCSKDGVDKIVIVYHDYAFSLVGVSLTESNDNAPAVRLGGRYKFSAKDIQLESLSQL